MHVVVFGATGAIGRQAIPALLAAGHEVTAVSRSTRRQRDLVGTGARIVLGDLLEADVVAGILQRNQPDAIVHVATALPDPIDPKHPDRVFATTNRLRADGTRVLTDLIRRTGRPVRLVTQGVAFLYEPGDTPAYDSTPLLSTPPKRFESVVQALAEQERLTREAGGVSLRFGHLYGPGTSFAPDGSMIATVRGRKLPLIRGGHSVFSFTHTADAATAVVAAVSAEGIEGQAFNVVDDRPVPLDEWLPYLAGKVGARKPPRVPVAMAKMAAGGWGAAYLSALRGASNRSARERLGWEPRYRTWFEGIDHDLDSAGAADTPTSKAA